MPREMLINILCSRGLRCLLDVSANGFSFLPKLLLPRVAALKVHFVYLCQGGSRKQVILVVQLELVLLGLLA